jgi:hypothetical protein
MVLTTHFFCHRVADTYSYRQEHLRSHRLLSQILWSCRLLALYWSLVAVDLRIASNEDGGLTMQRETKRQSVQDCYSFSFSIVYHHEHILMERSKTHNCRVRGETCTVL